MVLMVLMVLMVQFTGGLDVCQGKKAVLWIGYEEDEIVGFKGQNFLTTRLTNTGMVCIFS